MGARTFVKDNANKTVWVIKPSSGYPARIPFGAKYGCGIVIGFTQGIGVFQCFFSVNNGNVSVKSLLDGTTLTNPEPAITFDSSTNEIIFTTNTSPSRSKYTVVFGNSDINN